MIGYGFAENIDFTSVQKSTVVNNGAEKPIIDHIMKLDMAKELCMLARNEKGKQARQYFLEVEREWNSPEKVMARALKLAEAKLNEVKAFADEQTKQLEAAQPKVIFADAVATAQTSILNPYWRSGQNLEAEWRQHRPKTPVRMVAPKWLSYPSERYQLQQPNTEGYGAKAV